MRRPIRIQLFVLLLFCGSALAGDYTAPGVTIAAGDPSGIRFKPLSDLEVGDSLSVELTGAQPRSTVELLLEDDKGREWSYSAVHSNARGDVPRTLFWYQSGVIGTTARKITFRPDPSLLTFDEAEQFFAGTAMHLTVRERDGGRVLATRDFRPRKRATPFVYPSNGAGVLENAINARDENLYVTGRNFPAGATIQLFLVPNRFGWAAKDSFQPTVLKTLTLGSKETGFTAQVLAAGTELPGTFDIIARTGPDTTPVVLATDVVSFGEDTGVVLYSIIDGNIVIESAGRYAGVPAYFEFSNYFEKGQDVYGAVDPTDVPSAHTGGNYAAYWTVADQPREYWDAPSPALADVSGDGPEITRVKFWCINITRVKLWSAATQAEPVAGYDVIVDFGAAPANTAAEFVMDNTYNKGVDFIDGYLDAGFSVYERPDATGPYQVASVEYRNENGISGITDPAGVTGPTYPIQLAWAWIMYPAASNGIAPPVAPGGPFPVALFMHGRHWNCDFDGSGPGTFGGYDWNCSVDNRVRSHEGYIYIMEKLASQGVFCISISTHDIQPDMGVWNYNVRGRLALKFLDMLREWNTLGNDPYNGIFHGKLDMSRIALSGHSRGGEGVVAATVLNATWPNPHSIVAVNAIAPTDQNPSGDYLPNVPYFLLLGARDGDVLDMQGLRTYDHAYPQGMANRKMKATAWVYGANHNYFNTVWTPTVDLGAPNPAAGSVDDCRLMPNADQPNRCQLKMTAAAQRQVALSTITAFFRWQLQNVTGYREVLTGVLEPAAMDNANVFWTFQDEQRNAIDNFEQQPLNPSLNTVLGMASAIGTQTFEERLLNAGNTSYNPAPPSDAAFFHDTIGLKLQALAQATYTTEIPDGPARDVSMYSHLTLRIAKKSTVIPAVPGPDITVHVNIEDAQGHTGFTSANASNFQRTPHPFAGSRMPNLATLTGVRIPLRYFTMNNSQVDLTNIAKIKIVIDNTEIGLDDIEFGK